VTSRSPSALPLLVAVALAGAVVAACGSSKTPAAPSDPNPPAPCAAAPDCPAVACQVASCSGGACAYADAALATTCDDGLGGKFCDGQGSCVECNSDAECLQSADVCTESVTCIAHTCNPRFYPGGEPPGGLTQTPGDCVTLFCDAGLGLVLNFTPGDVVTTTSNPCTHVECYVASRTPPDPLVAATVEQRYPEGTPCPGGVCDPTGVCSTIP
jgi:hypothetical protein